MPKPDNEGDASPFAVPETPEERHTVMSHSVLPESDADEELLIGQRSSAWETVIQDRFEKWFVLLLFLLGILAVAASSPGVGMAWDEAYYVDIAEKTLNWINAAAGSFHGATTPEILNQVWAEPPGHPSVTRFLTAMGWALKGESRNPLWALRLPIAVCFGLCLVILYLLVRRTYGRVSAWIAVLAFFLMPRVFGYAHFATTEIPMVLMSLLVVYAFLRGLEGGWWALATGILLGLAFATKINALFLPLILLPWAFVFHRGRSVNNLYAMLFIAPVVMALSWPWLWSQPVQHFLEYLYFNFSHAQLGTLYFGTVYNSTFNPVNPPWHYPLVMISITLPLVTLGLVVLGIARTLTAPVRQNQGLLFLWAALLPCVVQMLGSVPKYDGERLILNAFPFLAVLAGIGGGVLVRIAASFDREGRRPRWANSAILMILLLIIADGGRGIVKVNPYYLSYFNDLIGGRTGAQARGIEVAFWGDALTAKGQLEKLNDAIPDGSSLMPLAMNEHVLELYQKWGLLKAGIRLAKTAPADYHLLQYRRGMYARAEATLAEDYTPLITIGPTDSPMFGLYKTGPEFEKAWQLKKR